jgi:ABC-type polysaccharide/polyol phosphate export permease
MQYDSSKDQVPAFTEIFELWRYRDFVKLLVANSIKTRYKRSALGVVWTLLNPLLNTLVLTIAFSQLLRFDIDGYPIFLLVGYLVWTFFRQTTTSAMNNLIWGSSLIKRIYIPRTSFAISVSGNGLVNILLSLIPIFIVMLFFRTPFTWNLLFLPVAILLLAVFTLGVSLILSTIAVYFVDMVDLYNVLLQALFFATPIIYPLSFVPKEFQPFFRLNPLYYYVELFRNLIFDGSMPSGQSILLIILLSFSALIIGWWIFTRKADEFAYRI